jgi:ABC-type nickel/cobalt efflux system permease component RcnA
VPHNPSYFVGQPRSAFNDAAQPIAVVSVLVSILLAVGWLIKTFVDYRRWSRLAHVQAEAHAKLLDRFTASQDLLAYLDTPAGRRFLESTPIQIDGGSVPGSPVNRILLSTQAGFVLTADKLRLYLAIPRLTNQTSADPLFVVAVLAMSLGIGFVVSAGMAFLLSERLGVLQRHESRKA